MLIPIDIIWIDNYRIIHIEEFVSPPQNNEKPTILSSHGKKSNFVLELAAGQVKELSTYRAVGRISFLTTQKKYYEIIYFVLVMVTSGYSALLAQSVSPNLAQLSWVGEINAIHNLQLNAKVGGESGRKCTCRK